MTDSSKVMRRTDSTSKAEVCDEEERCSVGCFNVQNRSCQVAMSPSP